MTISFRRGFPDNTYLSLWDAKGKPKKVKFENRFNILFADPITLFCSCINRGIFKTLDANPIGKLVYPPKEKTKFGPNFFSKTKEE